MSVAQKVDHERKAQAAKKATSPKPKATTKSKTEAKARIDPIEFVQHEAAIVRALKGGASMKEVTEQFPTVLPMGIWIISRAHGLKGSTPAYTEYARKRAAAIKAQANDPIAAAVPAVKKTVAKARTKAQGTSTKTATKVA